MIVYSQLLQCSVYTCAVQYYWGEPHTSVTALRTCVCIYLSIYACLDRPLTINFKSAHSNISRWFNFTSSVQLSRENEREGLLPDYRVGVKESESEDYSSWMHWQYTWQLTFWTMVLVWQSRDKAGCEWHSDSRVRVYAGFRYAPGMTTHT